MEFVEFTGRKDGQTKWGPHCIAVSHIWGVFQTDDGFVLETAEGAFDLGKDRRDELVEALTA